MEQLGKGMFFESESNWPFSIRQNEINKCLTFLKGEENTYPKLLRVFGESGSGKSFFIKELLAKLTFENFEGAALYIDTPAADLEASTIFVRIEKILEKPKTADRAEPNFISKELASKWISRKLRLKSWKTHYIYRVTRDLVGQIPGFGSIIKAMMPISLTMTTKDDDGKAGIGFLAKLSDSKPVVLVLDNIQFLSPVIMEMFEQEFHSFGRFFSLIVIERIFNERRINWKPFFQNQVTKDIELGPASIEETLVLVKSILPGENDIETLSRAIHRRSHGNLKSIWFQLKLISSRRNNQLEIDATESYEGVIQSLQPTDQAVLRLVVFLLGGLSIYQLIHLFEASHLKIGAEIVLGAITDLTAIGLLVINSEHHDKVRVEHELVAQLVVELTPEEEKLEIRQHLVNALSQILDTGTYTKEKNSLYDRLIGIAHDKEIRESPILQSHIVRFIHDQHTNEKFTYLATICRDSVCWDILDILPSPTILSFLNAIQKCSLFSFGLVAVESLKRSGHKSIVAIFEAKYLVQLFRYEEARLALKEAPSSKEKDAIKFNIMINLCEDNEAAQIVEKVYDSLSYHSLSEQDFLILRNSGHLFSPKKGKRNLTAAIEGFKRMGSQYGVATSLNNLGIVEIFAGRYRSAEKKFEESRQILSDLGSNEAYQPCVNLSALAMKEGAYGLARQFLGKAREMVPKSLRMDEVMINFNDATLYLMENKISSSTVLELFQGLHYSATKTCDIRFMEVLGWFCSQLENHFLGHESTLYSKTIEKKIFNDSLVGLELIISKVIDERSLEIPYILSPHWRY